MARKNLLKGLMDEAKTPAPETKSTKPAYSKGAIGAVSRQIEELKSRAVVEIDPFKIKSSGLHDRLEHDDAAHQTLIGSIRDYGQQVPVLVRPDPEADGSFLIVYGRRRVLALRDLKQPVRAMIRDLDDAQAIMAQGQENSARRDLSFIERVNFARQMVEADYDRKAICDALSTDKTLISRMLKVAEILPVDIIEQIGAAPGIGRDRWLAFAGLWEAQNVHLDEAQDMMVVQASETSDARFEALMGWLETRRKGRATMPKARAKPTKTKLNSASGTMGHMSKSGDILKIELSSKKSAGFSDWLSDNIEDIHRDWLKKQTGE